MVISAETLTAALTSLVLERLACQEALSLPDVPGFDRGWWVNKLAVSRLAHNELLDYALLHHDCVDGVTVVPHG